MATWEDGPEYAPVEPPDRFTVPDVPPLAHPQPVAGPPAAPGEQPQFGNPSTPVAPLAALSPADAAEHRDPRTPYRIESMTMTDGGGSAWGAAHWHSPTTVAEPAAAAGGAVPTGGPARESLPGNTAAPQTGAAHSGPAQPWGNAPVHGTPWPPEPYPHQPASSPAPGTPGWPEQRPAQPASNFPAPGTPGWFGPGSSPAPVHQPPPPPSLGNAIPTAAIIALAAAILVVTAPFAFAAGFLLTLNAKYARRQLMIAWAIVAGSILLISTLSTVSNYGDLTGWYGAFQVWSLVGSLLMIMLTVVIVNHQIKEPIRPGQPDARPTDMPGYSPETPSQWNQPPPTQGAPIDRPPPPAGVAPWPDQPRPRPPNQSGQSGFDPSQQAGQPRPYQPSPNTPQQPGPGQPEPYPGPQQPDPDQPGSNQRSSNQRSSNRPAPDQFGWPAEQQPPFDPRRQQ